MVFTFVYTQIKKNDCLVRPSRIKSLHLHIVTQCPGSVAGIVLRCERKVRAAKGAPLLKVEAIGDSRCRQKKITATPCEWKG